MKFKFKTGEQEFVWEFTQVESDNKTPANVSGFGATLQVKNRSTGVLGTPIVGVVDAPSSKATFTIPTNFFNTGNVIYDADLKWVNGAIVRYSVTFTIEVEPAL